MLDAVWRVPITLAIAELFCSVVAAAEGPGHALELGLARGFVREGQHLHEKSHLRSRVQTIAEERRPPHRRANETS